MRVTNATKPTPSDLRLEIAARTARAPAPPPAAARPRRSDEQRIAELAQRIESLRERAQRPRAVARTKAPRGARKAAAQAAPRDAFEAELRSLVDDFVEKVSELLARRTLARAAEFLDADGPSKAPRR